MNASCCCDRFAGYALTDQRQGIKTREAADLLARRHWQAKAPVTVVAASVRLMDHWRQHGFLLEHLDLVQHLADRVGALDRQRSAIVQRLHPALPIGQQVVQAYLNPGAAGMKAARKRDWRLRSAADDRVTLRQRTDAAVSMILARPLFDATRHLPRPPEEVEMVPRLCGIIITQQERLAMFSDGAGGRTRVLSRSAFVGRWRVVDPVEQRTLAKGDTVLVVRPVPAASHDEVVSPLAMPMRPVPWPLGLYTSQPISAYLGLSQLM